MPKRSSSDGAKLRSAISALGRRLRKADEPAPIGPTGFAVLGLLLRVGAASASELAELAGVQPQSLTRALAALEKEKLIVRRTDNADRRRAIMWVTPKGEDLLRTTMRRRVAWLNAAIDANLNDEERKTLRAASELMERLAGGEAGS